MPELARCSRTRSVVEERTRRCVLGVHVVYNTAQHIVVSLTEPENERKCMLLPLFDGCFLRTDSQFYVLSRESRPFWKRNLSILSCFSRSRRPRTYIHQLREVFSGTYGNKDWIRMVRYSNPPQLLCWQKAYVRARSRGSVLSLWATQTVHRRREHVGVRTDDWPQIPAQRRWPDAPLFLHANVRSFKQKVRTNGWAQFRTSLPVGLVRAFRCAYQPALRRSLVWIGNATAKVITTQGARSTFTAIGKVERQSMKAVGVAWCLER